MALVGNLICNIGQFKITNLNGIVNVGMTLNKHGESHGDTIIFRDEEFPVDDFKDKGNTQLPNFAIPMGTTRLNPVNNEY
ncbi:hypothetical protein J1P26_20915 [Neobacillus sp. MM2021_6]|uniref:hypothetical protein n=1 Tax=Bacillaceae TaxID=186817 RepID=UPI00140E4A50|nr:MULTISPECIES: hypothetical protein [Bacillaceae]MBO0962173.1 hypothetical protein [Neobacillus sp. MM2021_6]NHC21185.1 hypothetical protein [Bacillus sp. MM2020_4]